MKNQNLLGQESIKRLLFKYSIPAIIGMIVNAFYNIVDRIFIGKIPDVGAMAITGVGITMPITSILLGFGMLVGIGTTANISLKLGQGKREEAEKLLGNAFILTLIISVIITIIGIIFQKDILEVFGASSNTMIYAEQYIYIIFIGTIFNLLSFSLNSTIRADGNPLMAAITMIIGCVLNVVLDPIFIFVFKWGIVGAALATVISQAVSAFIIIYYYTKGKSNLKIKKVNFALQKKLVLSIFAIGVAPFSMQIATSLVQIIANNALKTYGGDLAIGAMATIASISMLFMMPTFGINQGSQPIIGYNYGAKKYDRVKKTVKLSLLAATCILSLGFILIQTFPKQAIAMFNNDYQLMSIGAKGLRIYLLMMPLVSIPIVGSSYFQSVGKAKLAMFLSLLRQVILLIPLTLVLPTKFGLDGVWMAGACSDFLATIITFIFLIREFSILSKASKENNQSDLEQITNIA